MKKCKICEIEKPFSDFSGRIIKKKNDKKYYYSSYCKSCHMEKYYIPKTRTIIKKHFDILKNCRLCGKEFTSNTNPKKDKDHCSKKCRYEVQSRIYSLRQELRRGAGKTKSLCY